MISLHFESKNQWVFDAKMLKKAGLSLVNLPTGSLVINQQKIWLEENKKLFLTIAGIFLLGAIIIARLISSNRRQAHTENDLRRNQEALKLAHQTLEQRVTQRTAELAVAKEKAESANQSKSQFLANMSHELRTPLNSILGMTEVLAEQLLGRDQREAEECLKTVESSGAHLLELINDILDLSKIEAGQIELELSSTAIAPLCQSSLNFIQQMAETKGIRIETHLPPNPPNLDIDERRIRQVLINLLSNATKFTPNGGQISLEVSQGHSNTIRSETPDPYLHIAVRDTGIGLAPEDIEKVFQPFVQIESALNRKHDGTGLGLSLAKRIVELHGGKISVTSEPGAGSCFMIDLPCHNMTSTALLTDPPEMKDSEIVTSTTNNTNSDESIQILLAEDNEANISTLASYLSSKGYRLLIANNGQEALELAQSQCPDIILMDIQMPEMDGLEATTLIRRESRLVDIPIIALTALAMQGDRERCLAAGATVYMSKPVKLKQLLATIKDLLPS